MKAETLLQAGDRRGCIQAAMQAVQLGESPRAHRMLARYFIANDRMQQAISHYDRAVACVPDDWELLLEAAKAIIDEGADAGAGLPPKLAAAAERYARECVELCKRERLSLGAGGGHAGKLSARDAAYVAAELKSRTMCSRMMRVRGDGRAADAVSAEADDVARTWLDPATARLPRLGAAAAALPTTLLGRAVRVERISTHPLAYRIRGLLNGDECDQLIRLAMPTLNLSGVAVRGGGQSQGYRTSSTAWVPTADDPVLRKLTERVATLMGLPAARLLYGEAEDAGKVQVVSYRPGQQYGVHHDCNGSIRRFATCLYYLNDVEEGGETQFPAASDDRSAWSHLGTSDAAIDEFIAPEHKASLAASETERMVLQRRAVEQRNARQAASGVRDEERGAVVKPTKGDAVLWYNYDANGHLDPLAVHSALPVRRGHKFASNHWISLTPAELLQMS
jgi:hypothetical protein